MKQNLLVTYYLKNEFVGPALFSRLIFKQKYCPFDLLTEDCKENNIDNLITIKFKLNFIQKRLGAYFRSKYYFENLKPYFDKYRNIIFIDGKLAYFSFLNLKQEETFKIWVMINDEKFISYRSKFGDYGRNFILKMMEKRSILEAHNIIVPSNYLKQKIVQSYRIDPNKIKILYKSIDITIYPFNPDRNFGSREISVLFIKNDFEVGGLFDLKKAIDLLQEYLFSVHVIGPGPKDFKEIQHLFGSTINANMQFYGCQPQRKVIQHLCRHDILCIPSRSESLGVANIEGLATGIPVVTTNVGGIPEVTNNGKHAWTCTPNSPMDLAFALKKCIESTSKEKKQKAILGREWVEKYFTSDLMFKNFKKMLDSN